MAQALPSFVELLASLDLESEENSEVQHYALYPTSPSFVTSTPSSALPSSQASPGRFLTSPESATSFSTSQSPSIVISHPSPVDDSAAYRRRSISNRYNPYVPPNAFIRRRSLPGDLMSHPDHIQQRADPSRASTASPPIRRASLGDEPSPHLSTNRITISKTDQPISAFVRHRHPHSPRAQSPEFRKAARRSVSPTDVLMPVSLPSLPPFISALDHGSTYISEHHDLQSGATARTPTPPRKFHDHGIPKNVGHPPPC